MASKTFTVTGENTLHCGGCETRVANALKRMEGVSAVDASHTSQVVTVDYDDAAVTVEDLRARFQKLGYAVEG